MKVSSIAVVAVLLSGLSAADAAPRGANLVEGSAADRIRTATTELALLADDSAAGVLERLVRLAGSGVLTPSASSTSPPAWLAGAPATLRPAVATLWSGIEQARRHVAQATAGLSPAELDLFINESHAIRDAARATVLGLASPEQRRLVQRAQSVASRIRVDRLAAAARALVDASERAVPMLRAAPSARAAAADCASGPVVFEAPLCQLVIGGRGSNAYDRDIAVLVDLGGSDLYTGNAGGAGHRLHPGAAILLDLGSGDDVYRSVAGPGEAVQGGAYLGAALLMDEGGDDVYEVTATSSELDGLVVAQGSTIFGAGILWDRGEGDDRYTSRNTAQGSSQGGIGLLLDEGGSDAYTMTYTFDSEGGQGSACVGGVAALVDRGAGDDVYDAAIDDNQGFGCIGALGLLWDGGGADAYILRSGLGLLGVADPEPVLQSGWGQGYGELGGAGIVYDRGGDDAYVGEIAEGGEFEGFYAQGMAAGGGLGLLLDLAGDDAYVAGSMAQAAADLGGAGLLVDLAGNDAYTATTRCQGFADGGLAALLDTGGGHDTYRCAEPASRPRSDDRTWTSGTIGVGIDR